jgi:hypothetical protein
MRPNLLAAPDAAATPEGEHVNEHAQCSACFKDIAEDDGTEEYGICNTCCHYFHWPSTAACQQLQPEHIRSLRWDHEHTHEEGWTNGEGICPTCHYRANGTDGSRGGDAGAAVGHDRCFKESDSDEEEVDNAKCGFVFGEHTSYVPTYRAINCKMCDEDGGDLVECTECRHAFHNSLSGQAGDLCRQSMMDNHAAVYKWLTEDEEGGLEAYQDIFVRQIDETCPTCCFDDWHAAEGTRCGTIQFV